MAYSDVRRGEEGRPWSLHHLCFLLPGATRVIASPQHALSQNRTRPGQDCWFAATLVLKCDSLAVFLADRQTDGRQDVGADRRGAVRQICLGHLQLRLLGEEEQIFTYTDIYVVYEGCFHPSHGLESVDEQS